MRKIIIVSLGTAALLAGVSAAAQNVSAARSAAAPASHAVEVTRSEVQDRAGRVFARMDANQDGQIDGADREARREARFERLDTDGDGALSPDEFRAPGERRADARRPAPRVDRRSDARGFMAPRPGRMAAGRRADTDGDGKISRDEFTARALARFDRADANADGTITAEERQARRGLRRGPAAS